MRPGLEQGRPMSRVDPDPLRNLGIWGKRAPVLKTWGYPGFWDFTHPPPLW